MTGFLRNLALLLPALLFSVQFFGCTKKESLGPPNIIVISVDGLRADYLTPERMPLVNEFAAQRCRIFENARANSTRGKPSHATLLTGLLQSEHGVEYDDSVIPIEIEMVQERLRKSGYTTAAFVSDIDLSAEFAFDRGFEIFKNVATSLVNTGSGEMALAQRRDRRMAAISEGEHFLMSQPDQPVFLYIQTNAVSDYWRDEPFPNFPIPGDNDDEQSVDVEAERWEHFKEETSTDRKRLLYAAAVREVDRRLHGFLQILQYSPLSPNTKLIVTSAYGEGLGDRHGDYVSYGHAGSPYSDRINVPLVVYGLDKGRSAQLVGLDDVAGTILAFAGIEKEPAKSLFRPRERIISEDIAADRSPKTRSVAYMTIDHKFLVAADQKLYVFTDPLDANDLIRLQYAEVIREDISEELKEQLGALGYVQD